ncbi:ubiquitin carboxyl-terminal hydrolase 42 [Hyperolius riggenbachi]|uniref:ubiquitin carboxyl-terminal hydrolase 42 n=1 Tax=Hyperolius riggenbachi TaxID=752182 RepID=UPI0035A2820C
MTIIDKVSPVRATCQNQHCKSISPSSGDIDTGSTTLGVVSALAKTSLGPVPGAAVYSSSSVPEKPVPSEQNDPLSAVPGDGISAPEKILFPAEKIRLKWLRVQKVGAGLQNLGNTCFLNSVLQCLTYTAPLANYMLSREHSKTCREPEFCMMCVMQCHIIQALSNSGSVIKPTGVINDLRLQASNDQWYLMNDSIVSSVDIRTVLNQQAYLLFYIRSQNVPNGDTSYTLQSASPNSPQPSCSQRAGVSKFSFMGPQQVIKNVKHMNGNRSPKSTVNGTVLNNNCTNVKRPMGAVPVNRQVSINSTVKKQKITITINKPHPVHPGLSLHDAPKMESTNSSSLTSMAIKSCPTLSTSSVPAHSESKHAPIRLNRGTLVNGKSKVTSSLLVPYGTESSEESEEEQKGIRKRRWSGKCGDETVTTNGHSALTDTPDRSMTLAEEVATTLESSPSLESDLPNHDTFDPVVSNSQNSEAYLESNASTSLCELSKDSEPSLNFVNEDTTTTAVSPSGYPCESTPSEQRNLLRTETSLMEPEAEQNMDNNVRLSDSESASVNKSLPPSSGSSEDYKRNGERHSPSFDRSRSDRYRSSDGREYRHRDYYNGGHYKHRDYERQRSRSRGRTGERYPYTYYHSKRERSRSRDRQRRWNSPHREHRVHYERDYWPGKDYKSGWFPHNRGRDYGYNNHHSSFYPRHPDSYHHHRKFNGYSNGYSNYHQDYGSSKRRYHHDGSSGEDDYDRGSKRLANHNRSPPEWPRDQ